MPVREIAEADIEALEECYGRFPARRFPAPTCAIEMIHGEDRTRVHGDRAASGHILQATSAHAPAPRDCEE